MTNRIGITVHHQEGVFAACDHQMRGVIARPCRLLEKIRVRFFPLKIFDPPRRPKRFQFSFREFHRAARVKLCVAKSSQHFRWASAASQSGMERARTRNPETRSE